MHIKIVLNLLVVITELCIYEYIYIHTLTRIHIHASHVFFIHSSVDGHFGCFHVLENSMED